MKESMITTVLSIFCGLLLLAAIAGICLKDRTAPVISLNGKNTLIYTEGDSYDVSDKIPETLPYDGKNYVKFSVIGAPVSGTANGNKHITVYYEIDELIDTDKDPDPTLPGDGIPDMYQKKITFKVVNGACNDGTAADQTVCVTLTKDGEWDVNGSAILIAPMVGRKPYNGFRAGNWDVVPPAIVRGTNEEVYTYTYDDILPILRVYYERSSLKEFGCLCEASC
jgi:hypothetical protein